MRPDEDEHPEQDPAEGSREVIDKDLAQQAKQGDTQGKKAPDGKGKSERGS